MKLTEIVKQIRARHAGLISALFLSAILAACTTTQKGMGVGAAGGAVAGGLIGSASGNTTTGALIGAGVGAVGGGLVGEHIDQDKGHDQHHHD